MGFDWSMLLSGLLRLLGAFVLAFPIGWEREQRTRIMGLRTFPLAAVGSCAYVLIASYIAGDDNQARIIQGLMSGIGFIGGGALLKEGTGVKGTATAASIWTTGAIGAAVGYRRYEIAVVTSLITFLTLRALTPLEKQVGKSDREDSEKPSDRPD